MIIEGTSPETDERCLPRISPETTRIAAGIAPSVLPDLFERAAVKVERYASQFSRWTLPWYATPEDVETLDDLDDQGRVYEGDDDWRVAVMPTPVGIDAPEPHEFNLEEHGALPLLPGQYVVDDLPPVFARWAAMLGPQVGGALVAMLREGAHLARAGCTPDRDVMLRHLAELAVEILHEEDPRDVG